MKIFYLFLFSIFPVFSESIYDCIDSKNLNCLIGVLEKNPRSKDQISPDGYSPLQKTVLSEWVPGMKQILSVKPNLNYQSKTEKGTAVLFAALKGKNEIISPILEAGADPNIISNHDFLPFASAVEKNCSDDTLELFEKFKANLNPKKGETPLGAAIKKKDWKCTEKLLDKGADIKLVPAAFHHAIADRNKDMVKLFLKKGANPNLPGRINNAFFMALMSKNQGIIDELMDSAKPDLKVQDEGETLLHSALKTGNEKFADYFVENSPLPAGKTKVTKETLLHFAAKGGNLKYCKFLLEKGLNVNEGDFEGSTPFLILASSGPKDLNTEVIEEFLKYKPNLDVAYKDTKQTAMHYFMSKKNKKAVKLLLQNGANPDLRDNNGQTVRAFYTKERDSDILELMKR